MPVFNGSLKEINGLQMAQSIYSNETCKVAGQPSEMMLELAERYSAGQCSISHSWFYIFAVPSKYFVHLIFDELFQCLCLINYSVINVLSVSCGKCRDVEKSD